MMNQKSVTVLSMLVIAFPLPVDAYLDPGTGSILLQGLLAGAAGVAVVGRLYWVKIKQSARRTFGRKDAKDERADREPQELAAPPDP